MITYFLLTSHTIGSRCGAKICDSLRESLVKRGCSCLVSDLYDMNFNPILTNIATNKDEVIQTEINKLLQTDLLIMQFPLWWFGVPAILKGWIDRIVIEGEVYQKGKVYKNGKFVGKKCIFVITAGSPERMFNAGGHGSIKDLLTPLTKTFEMLGFKVIDPFMVYQTHSLEEDALEEISRRCVSYVIKQGETVGIDSNASPINNIQIV